MIKGGSGSRFLFEPSHPIVIRGNLDGKDLQRHLAMKPHIFRQIHLAHPAFANL
jgi:hypothetical protein